MDSPEAKTSDATPVEPITGPEIEHHIPWIRRAIESVSKDERDQALSQGLVLFGMRFSFSLAELDRMERQQVGGPGRFASLSEACRDLSMEWLGGRSITDRADEPERRARLALDLARLKPGLGRLAAQSVLELPRGHPLRDESIARALLEDRLAAARSGGDLDSELRCAANLLEYELLPDEQTAALVSAVEAHLAGATEPDARSRRDFIIQVMHWYARTVIAARDAGDEGRRTRALEHARRWLARLEGLVEPGTCADPKDSLIVALVHELDENYARAAGVYASLRAQPELPKSLRAQAAKGEARMRLELRDPAGVIEALLPVMPVLQDDYLTAVEDQAIQDAGRSFAKEVSRLAFAHAQLDRWDEAVRWLEHGKSLRLRYRAALRASREGREVMARERALHAVTRGAMPTGATARADRAADWLGASLTLESEMLEAYRRARPKLAKTALATPSVRTVARTLATGEAVALFGMHFSGSLLAVIRPGDTVQPSGRFLRPEENTAFLAEMLAGQNQDGWLFALAAPELALDKRAVLERLLVQLEGFLAPTLGAFVREHGVRRLTIVPHLWYHLIPFWAVPCLAGCEITVSPSLSHVLASRRPRSTHKNTTVVVASDPTGDLPLSSVEFAAMRHRLGWLGVGMQEFSGLGVTESALEGALPGAALFHFSGHGLSDPDRPTRSALLLHPAAAGRLAAADGDPIARAIEQATAWKAIDTEERYADVAGLGRLYERTMSDGKLRHLWLEHAEHGTLFRCERDGRAVRTAELWTAGDIAVQGMLDRCQLAFLSACETGGISIEGELDECSGLPAAFLLAGVPAVVCTLWPVSDGFTALYVDLFYELLGRNSGRVNIAALVLEAAARFRTMPAAEAAVRAEALREHTNDPKARFRLEALAHRLREGEAYPFSHPADWAAFYVSGAGEIDLPAPPQATDENARRSAETRLPRGAAARQTRALPRTPS